MTCHDRRLARLWPAAAVVLACCVPAALAAGQTSAVLEGRVLDATGAAIAGADVRVDDALHGTGRTTTTDVAGRYRVTALPPGTYEVSAVAAGFSRSPARPVVLRVDSTTRADVLLAVAGVFQSIEVAGDSRSVRSAGADLGATLLRDRIDALPLNRRDFLQLAMVTPGVVGPVEDSELSSRGGFAMHANGAREEANAFLLDGVDNNDPYTNRYVVQVPVDSVEEFKIATSSYSAEYGRNAGAQVNVVTRRGTNAVDAFVYEYFRDRALDARNFFDGATAPPFSRSQFGGGFGGPLARNRTFLFASLDVLHERKGLSRLGTVPTAAMRAGDLSALPVTIVDPLTRLPFPGNVIPSNRISPLARHVLDLFPLPTSTGLSGNYLGHPTGREDATQATVRVDHSFGPVERLMIRYSGGRTSLFEPYAEEAGALPGFGDELSDRASHAVAEYQHGVGSRAVNAIRVGVNRLGRDLLPENHDTDVAAAWGVGWLPSTTVDRGYPVLNVAGFSRVGDVTSLPIVRTTETLHVVDSLSIERGRHLLKLGAEMRHARLDGELDLLTRGSLSFSGALSGSGMSDLLLGLPSFALKATADNPMSLRSTAWGAYVQDDWTVGPALTLNLGVRYDYATPPADPGSAMSDYVASTGTLARVGTSGVPKAGIRADRDNVAPRLGLAWMSRDGTTVRAGYGLYFDTSSLTVATTQYFNPPWFTMRMYFPSALGLLTLDNPFPSTNGVAPPAALNVLSPDLQTSSMQHWNVAIERRAGVLGTVSAAYAGSAGRHLVRPRDLNQPRPGAGDVQSRRPNRLYGSIFSVESAGTSSYHALQLALDRPLTRHWSLRVGYTLSRSIDDGSAFLDTKADRNFPQDSGDVGAERGPSSFDARHRATVAWTIELPSTSVWTRGTSLRALATFQSGQPFTPLLRFDNSNTGNGGSAGWDRPSLVGSPSLADPTADAWFDTSAFVVPERYTFGTAGRNSLRGPGYASVDVAMVRRFPVRGTRALFVEAQAFNVLNRTNFELPEAFADEPATFGRIFSARSPRQIQLAVRVAF